MRVRSHFFEYIGMEEKMQKTDFIDALLNQEILTKEQVISLVMYMEEQKKSEIQAIIYMGLLDNKSVAMAVAKRYSLKFVSLQEVELPEKDDMQSLTSERLYALGVIPFSIPKDVSQPVKIAVSDPTDNSSVEIISALIGRRAITQMALKSDINRAIDRVFKVKREEQEVVSEDIDVVNVVFKLLASAVRLRASDIHVEGMADKTRVRYRIDGTLIEQDQFPLLWLNTIVSRLKVLSGMDIAEKRLAQDGKFTEVIDKNEYDFRMSIIPTIFGEKAVLRIAPKRIIFSSKKQLGILSNDLEKLDRILSRRHGMVLVTGPTGCGKTTTLYSALSEINSHEKNTVTVEDPVEISITGINQVQVSNHGGMTFSNALRAILRQDPDVIMVGEIRDSETAKMSIQASITGHLVLSTLHTNSATSSINRLVNMGVERYLLADAIVGVVSQRLVRKLCEHCKEDVSLTKEQSLYLKVKDDTKICVKKGCEQCQFTGYNGRTSVFEILEIDENISKMIASDSFDTEKLNEYALQNGMTTLIENAKKLVLEGVTSFEEIAKLRVNDDLI